MITKITNRHQDRYDELQTMFLMVKIFLKGTITKTVKATIILRLALKYKLRNNAS